jgi:hypothetical protein
VASAILDAIHAGRNTLPACLGDGNPNRLVSLWDMLQVHAARFVTLLDHTARLQHQFSNGTAFNDPRTTGSVLSAVRQDCEVLGLVSTSKQVERIHETFAHIVEKVISPSWPELTALISELRRRIEEDLEEAVFFQVRAERIGTCFRRVRDEGLTQFTVQAPRQFFGDPVLDSFPSTGADIEAVRDCLFSDHATACVYHLMRVLEIGLRSLADRFGVPSDHANWNTMIEKVEKAIRDMASDPNRASDWRDQQQFFSQAATHFMFLKDAWRNYTAHAHGQYTDEQADLILVNVRPFMQKLATRLHE